MKRCFTLIATSTLPATEFGGCICDTLMWICRVKYFLTMWQGLFLYERNHYWQHLHWHSSHFYMDKWHVHENVIERVFSLYHLISVFMIGVPWILHLLMNGLQELWPPRSQDHWNLPNEGMWKTLFMLRKSNYLWQIMAIILNMHPVVYHDLWYSGH
jgi:hypothetical protein